MYLSRFQKWEECRKNKTQSTPNPSKPEMARARTRQKKKTKDSPVFEALFRILSANVASTLTPKSPHTCRQQEIVLQSVHSCTFGLFESHGWGFDKFSIFPTTPLTPNLADSWQQIADEAFGASVLFEKEKNAEATQTLQGVFSLLHTALSSPDPAMLVKFWGVARRFSDIGIMKGDQRLLLHFLQYCKSFLSDHQNNHPLLPVLVSLTRINQDALYDTLRIGYLKSIHSLKTFVRGDHATVLAMWSSYIKYWDTGKVAEAALAECYGVLIEEADRTSGDKHSSTSISVLHRALYAAHYVLDDAEMTTTWASDLLARSFEILGHRNQWQWGAEAHAFAFASKLLALTLKGQGDIEGMKRFYLQAIDCLQKGDRECQTRAIMLGGDLEQTLQ